MGAVDCRGPVVEAKASGKSPAWSKEKGMVALGRGGGPVLDPKQESHTAGFPQQRSTPLCVCWRLFVPRSRGHVGGFCILAVVKSAAVDLGCI